MKKLYIYILFLSILPWQPAYAALSDQELKESCENIVLDPEVVFYTSYGKLKYDRTYNRDQLSQLGKSFGMMEEGDLASGLALVDVASEYELSTVSRKMINGGVCIMPQELTVYIGFQNPVIYLAQDLKEGTCLHNLVVRHEQVHQQINVNALEYFIPLIYQQIKLIAADMRPMYVSSEQHIKSGTNDLTAFYAKKINHFVNLFKQEILIEQRKLDNRQQYQLESDICRNYNSKHNH